MSYSLLFGALTCIAIVSLTRYFIRPTKHYPPGPKPWPLIGNTLDIPSTKPWKVYADWSRSYGRDIIHFEVLGQHMMVVNSRELAHELFEKRSRIYSDRPYVPMVDLLGWMDMDFGFMPYGEKWRQHRRLFQEGLRNFAEGSEDHRIELEKAHELLVNLLKDPNNFRAHIRTWAAATIIGIMYGHDVAPNNDYFVDLAEKAVGTLLTWAATSATLVNVFPFMRYLPAWFPGCGFQNIVRERRGWVNDMVNKPYSIMVDNMKSAKHKPSVLAKSLDRHRADGGGDEQELMIKQVCATAYAAGADTTVSALSTFFMAMASHPHVQKKAQKQIDELITGGDRFPTWEDRPRLQYVEAVMRETFRWGGPVAPLGFFHSTLSDDMIDGYFVPKGTAVIGNIWAMTRDASVYPEPESFNPERFLKEDGTCNEDDVSFTFGFGRRLCPGRHMAADSLWITMASILATLDISKARDGAGNDIEIEVGYTGGFALHPVPFPCAITPRSDRARALLADVAQ